jgi:ATP/maltotriose-dependent transcriptional regulator MalT
VRAAHCLDRGDASGAVEEAQRYLRRVGEKDRFERAPGLELQVRASLGVGDSPTAESAAAELERTAAEAGTDPLRAAALLARGRVEAKREPAAARSALEDAIDLYAACGARYEAAQARLDLADVLRAQGRLDAADAALVAARSALAELGAPAPAAPDEQSLLTAREREVLLAQGRSNDAIASELVLSVRTVERHVENIYGKIGISGRSARAAATAWAHAHGLA